MYLHKQLGEVVTAIIVLSAISAAILIATPVVKAQLAKYKKQHAHRTMLVSNKSSSEVSVNIPIMQWGARVSAGMEIQPDYGSEKLGKNKLVSIQGQTKDKNNFSCIGTFDKDSRLVIENNGDTVYCELNPMAAAAA